MNLNKQKLAELLDVEVTTDYKKEGFAKDSNYSKKRKHGKDKRDRRERRKQKRGY